MARKKKSLNFGLEMARMRLESDEPYRRRDNMAWKLRQFMNAKSMVERSPDKDAFLDYAAAGVSLALSNSYTPSPYLRGNIRRILTEGTTEHEIATQILAGEVRKR